MVPLFKDFEFQCALNKLYDLKSEGKTEEVEILANKLLDQAIHRKNMYVKAIAYYYLAEVALIKLNSEKCIDLCWHILSIYKDREYDYLYALSCSVLGKAYGNKRDSYNALTFFIKGYYVCLDQGYDDLEYRILNNIGTLFFYLGYYEDAIKFYKEAMQKISKNGEVARDTYEIIFVNIMSVYIRMQDFESAKKWEELYNKEFPDTQNTVGYEGYIANRILESSHKKDYEKMSYHVHDLIEFSNRVWFGAYSVRLLFDVVKCCLDGEQFTLASECLLCIKKHIPENDIRTKYQLSRLFIELYKASHNTEKLIEEYEIYFELSKITVEDEKRIEYQGLQNKLSLEAELHAKQLLMRENAELSEKTEKDLFTGVLNKASFIEHVNRQLSKLKGQEYGVMLVIDVDDFKGVNDHFGHLAGDEALKKISELLLKLTRQTDYIGRIGGDEFCIYMTHIQDLSLLGSKIDFLIEEISNISLSIASDYQIKVSIGVAGASQCCDFNSLFAKADEALYQAKAKGKNTFVFHDE